jgi:hypothetical protein
MEQNKRILLALGILVVIVGIVLGIDALRRKAAPAIAVPEQPTLAAGSIPIYVDGSLVGGFSPADLENLEQTSFVDAEEGKTQEGWLLSKVLELHVDVGALAPESVIVVSSSSREKSAELAWGEADDVASMVMFDLSGRGTLKLVSLMEKLDTRDEWVQDVDKIEITTE